MPKKNEDRITLLENGTALLRVSHLGAVGGTYIGEFVVRCSLNPEQILAAGREYRTLLGVHMNLASDSESNLAFAISQLRQRVVTEPTWWQSAKVKDSSVLLEVLDMALEAEDLHRREILDRGKEAVEALQENIRAQQKQHQEELKKTQQKADKELSEASGGKQPKG